MRIGQQFLRYALVGLLSNAALYLLYLLLTGWGLEPKLAMSLLYCVGIVQTFFANRNWSFRSQAAGRASFIRYLLAYLVGYGVNLLGLMLLVDRFGLPHRWVQALMVVVVAMLLFMLQRFWVFRGRPKYVDF
jgi:putative flippase GtrA